MVVRRVPRPATVPTGHRDVLAGDRPRGSRRTRVSSHSLGVRLRARVVIRPDPVLHDRYPSWPPPLPAGNGHQRVLALGAKLLAQLLSRGRDCRRDRVPRTRRNLESGSLASIDPLFPPNRPLRVRVYVDLRGLHPSDGLSAGPSTTVLVDSGGAPGAIVQGRFGTSTPMASKTTPDPSHCHGILLLACPLWTPETRIVSLIGHLTTTSIPVEIATTTTSLPRNLCDSRTLLRKCSAGRL